MYAILDPPKWLLGWGSTPDLATLCENMFAQMTTGADTCAQQFYFLVQRDTFGQWVDLTLKSNDCGQTIQPPRAA